MSLEVGIIGFLCGCIICVLYFYIEFQTKVNAKFIDNIKKLNDDSYKDSVYIHVALIFIRSLYCKKELTEEEVKKLEKALDEIKNIK